MLRSFGGVTLAVIVTAAYLHVTLTAWDRFLFYQSTYSDELRQILGWGRMALLGSGGMIFGIIATRIGHIEVKLQVLISCSAVLYWLFPYSFIEGTFLPLVPVGGAVLVSSGALVGHIIVLRSSFVGGTE